MPSLKQLLHSIHSSINRAFEHFPSDLSRTAMSFASLTLKKTRFSCHSYFLRRCLRHHLLPRGFSTHFDPQLGHSSPAILSRFSRIDRRCGFSRMRAVLACHSRLILDLCVICPPSSFVPHISPLPCLLHHSQHYTFSQSPTV